MEQFAAKSIEASHLRRRKYELVREFALPENLVGGSLCHCRRRCGRSNCHCADGQGHSMWSITFSHHGQRRVERVPREWVEEVEQAVLATQQYLDAIKEVMAINLELLAQTRQQQLTAKRTSRTQKRQKRAKRVEKRSTAAPMDRSSTM